MTSPPNPIERQEPPSLPRPRIYNPGILHRPTAIPSPTSRKSTIKILPPPLGRDLADIVVRPCFQFRFLLRGRPEQCMRALGFGGIVLNTQVVRGEVSVVDNDGGDVGLRRLCAALPRV